MTDEEEDRIEDSINALLNLSDYSLPTLEISYNADEEDVADIFVRVNSGGQSLTENNFIQTLISFTRMKPAIRSMRLQQHPEYQPPTPLTTHFWQLNLLI